MKNSEKELKDLLWDIVMYSSYQRIVVKNIYRLWVVLVSLVFPNGINYLIIKHFCGRVIYFTWKNIWEWKILLSYLIWTNIT